MSWQDRYKANESSGANRKIEADNTEWLYSKMREHAITSSQYKDEGQMGQFNRYINEYEGNMKKFSDSGYDVSGYESVVKDFKSASKDMASTYSQFNNRGEYDAAIKAQENYSKMLNFDLKAGKAEISKLSGYLDKAKQFGVTTKTNQSGGGIGGGIGAQKYTNEAQNKFLQSLGYNNVDELQADITQKKAYLKQAKNAQNSKAYEDKATADSFFERYAKKGAEVSANAVNKTKTDYANTKLMSVGGDMGGATEQNNVDKALTYLSDDELKVYNYYYGKYGKSEADAYLSTIQDNLNQRYGTDMARDMEGKRLQEYAFGIAAGLDQFASGMNAIGKDNDHFDTSATQYASAGVREDLADAGRHMKIFGGTSVGQALYDIGTTTANMLPSIGVSAMLGMINPALGEVAGASLLGASAGGNAYAEMINLGYDKDQAKAYATMTGMLEAGLQYALGGVGKLGGKMSGDLIKNTVKGINNGAAKAAIKFGGEMFSEGFEESLQEVISPLLKNAIFNTDESVDWEQVAYSGILGALSAGMLNSAGAVTNKVNEVNTTKAMLESGQAENLIKLGQTFSADTVAHKLADKVNENSSAWEMSQLLHEVNASLSEQNQSDIANALIQKGMAKSDAETIAIWLNAAVNGKTFTKRQQKALEENEVIQEVFYDTIFKDTSTVNQRVSALSNAAENINRTSPVSERNQMYRDLFTAKPRMATNIDESEAQTVQNTDTVTASTDNVSKLKSTGDEVKVKEIASNKDGIVKLRLDDGTVVNASDVSLSETEAMLYNAVADMDVSAANSIIKNYHPEDGVSPTEYALGAKEAFNYGSVGMNYDYISKDGFAAKLTDNQRQYAYNIGQTVAKFNAKKAQESINEKVAEAKAKGKQTSKEGKVIYHLNENTDTEALKDVQKASIKMAETLSSLVGSDVHIFESVKKDGKYVLAEDMAGRKAGQTAPNGFFETKTGELWIDINAGNSGAGTMLYTLAHEYTHMIRKYAPEKFKALADFLVEEYGKKGVPMKTLIHRQMEKARKNGRTISFDTAYEEMVADSMETMLTDTNVAEKLEKLKQTDKTLWQKLKDMVTDLLNKVKSIYKSYNPNSVEANYVREMQDSLEKLSDLFAEGLSEAGEVYKTIGNANGTEDSVKMSDRDDELVNQSMSMQQCKDMIQRSFVMSGIKEWYEGEYKTGDEWLKAQGAEEVAMYIENEYTLTEKYLNKIPEYIDGDLSVEDILNAYLNGTLTGEVKKAEAKRLDTKQSTGYKDNRFYAPKSYNANDARKLYDLAAQKVTKSNKEEVTSARAKLLFLAHDSNVSELIGITQAEFNKKLRTWSRYSKQAMEVSNRINSGVPIENRWTGIQNCSIINKQTVSDDDILSMVKGIEGKSDEYKRAYIGRTMLALDTHIDWSRLTFDFLPGGFKHSRSTRGMYSNDRIAIANSGYANTVAHEMGHALDEIWGRDIFGEHAKGQTFLSDTRLRPDLITNPEARQFYDNFRSFVDKISDASDIRSSYTQDVKEVFARFIAKFVEFTDKTAGNNFYQESSMYNDRFTSSQYLEFARLLQEKAMLDSKKAVVDQPANETKLSDREEVEVYRGTKLGRNSASGITWYAENEAYAKNYGDTTAERITLGNVFDAGNTSAAIYNGKNLSPEAQNVLDEAGWSEKYLMRHFKNASYVWQIVNSTDFRDAMIRNGYDTIKAIETGDQVAYGVLNEQKNNTTDGDVKYSDREKITVGMTDDERAEILRHKVISAAIYGGQADAQIKANLAELESEKKSVIAKALKNIEKSFYIPREIKNEDFDIVVLTSSKLFNESASKKVTDAKQLARLMPVLKTAVEGAVAIKSDSNRYYYDMDTVLFHNMIGGYVDGENFVPIRFGIKQSALGKNYLYVVIDDEAIKKAEVTACPPLKAQGRVQTDSANISLANVFEKVNNKDILKYVPDSFLDSDRKTIKYGAIAETIKRTADKNDKKYAKYISEGNYAAAKEMVVQAARAAGYTIKAYHGSRNTFNVFSRDKLASNTKTQISEKWFFAADKETANSYYPYGVMQELSKQFPGNKSFDPDSLKNKGKLYELFIKMENPLEVDVADYDYDAHKDDASALMEYSEQAEENGNDGIILYHVIDNNLKTGVRESTDYLFKNPEQAKSADVVTYDDDGNIIPLSERFNPQNDDIRYSERDTESLDNRTVLANAMETAAQNDIEKKYISDYKANIEKLNAEEQKLGELKAEIKELSFAKGKRDTARLRELQDEATKTANRINTYDKKLLRLEAATPLKNVIERERTKARKQAIDKGRQSLENYRLRKSDTMMRHKVQKVVKDLNDYLLKGGKEKRVMLGLQKVVAEALDAINMEAANPEAVSKSIQTRMANVKEQIAAETDPKKIEKLMKLYNSLSTAEQRSADRLAKLKQAYNDIKNSDDPAVANGYDEVIAAKIDDVTQLVGDTALRNMNSTQLQAVYDLYKMILTKVRDANKAFKAAKNQSIAEISEKVSSELAEQKQHSTLTSKTKGRIEEFGWNNLKPLEAFKAIGSEEFEQVFRNVLAGEGTWARDINEAKLFYEKTAKEFNVKDWLNKKTRKQTFEFESTSGKKFNISLEQMMSLYAYSKREAARDHIRKGGIVIDIKTEVKKGIRTYNVTDSEAYNISDETLSQIVETLTPEQRKFVDKMQDYLSMTMGGKGNEISEAMYGVHLFGEKNYFPLKSSDMFLPQAKEQAQADTKIKNSGFTNSLVPHASNPVVLSDFTDTWDSHVDEMSRYHAFVLPLEDFYRVYNYKTAATEFETPTSIDQSIRSAHGDAAIKYIEQLLRDLNGGARTDTTAGTANRLLSTFKKGAVMGSASVVIQQPSAFARAFAYIEPKHFVGGRVKNTDKAWEELKKYAPVAVIKEMGGYDTYTGQSTKDYISGGESNLLQKFDDLLGKFPAKADEITWCTMWQAAKRKARSENLQGDKLLERAGDIFTEAIVNTQVYDSVLTRSANMRSKDGLMKMATAFMAEPTTSINMIADARLDWQRGKKGAAIGKVASVAASVVINAMLVALVYAARDDDDDETYQEKYLSSVIGKTIEGFNPITYIPFVKDIYSIFQGYTAKRTDLSVFSDMTKAVQNLFKAIEGDDPDEIVTTSIDTANSMLMIFGIPTKNIFRDGRAIANLFAIANSNEYNTERGTQYALKEGISDGSLIASWFIGDKPSKKQQLYESAVEGDTEHEKRVRNRYDTEDKANSAFKSAVMEYFNDGKISDTQAVTLLVSKGNMEREDAEEKVEKAKFKMQYGFNYNDRSEAYAEGKISKEELIKVIMSSGGKTREDAEAQVEIYDWQNEGIDIDTNQSHAVQDYHEFAEPYGISKKVYFDTYEYKNSAGEEGVKYSAVKATMPYINGLNLSPEQKTQLALIFWSQKTVNKYKLW